MAASLAADCAGTSGKTCTTTVTGGGLMTDLVLTRTEFGADMPETVQAQVGGSTVVLNQHQWNAEGTLAKAWQGDRSTGSGGSGIRHVWGRNATTGRLEGIGTEAFGSGATHGIARGYTHTAGGRVEKVWYNAGTLGTPSTSVQGFDYAHDTHGRREVVSPYLPDNAPTTSDQPPGWKYGYNERGEVEVADRFTAAGGPSTGVVTHQRRSYDYDLMGNRNTATQGTNIGELKETGYTANILQQYDGLTHTRQVEITGQAVTGATVELTLDGGTPITVNRSLPEHQTGDPDSFRYVHTVGGTDARWLHVSIKASLGGIDITRAGFSHVPPSSEALEYDEDGNLTETAEWDYTWDAENRLIVAEQKSLPVAGGLTAPARKKLEFDYDSKNRRISKRVYQSSGGGWSLTKDLRFVYDGWQMIAELDHTFATGTGLGGSAVNRTFLWGPDLSGSMTGAGGVGGLLSTTYQGITYQACSDANGNVTGLVPVSGTGAGTLVARFDYDPFGNRVTNAGPNVELCPFGFSSKYLDVESGIVSYELRGYLPGMGRWLSRDPIGEGDGPNVYAFLSNNSINYVDIDGRIAWGPNPNPNMPPGYNPLTGAPDSPPPPDLDPVGFAICWRNFESNGSAMDAIITGLGNILGGEHTYVHYKKCGKCPRVGWGFSGGNPRANPDSETAFKPNQCTTCERTKDLLKHGIGIGKKGLDASSDEIVDCIKNSPVLKQYNANFLSKDFYVCSTWAYQATASCGLRCK